MGDFVHLHVHGQNSLLDGLTKPGQLVDAAVADGAPAVSLTDHGSLGGILKAASAARSAGLKFLPGIEMYLSIGDRHEQNHVMVSREDDFDGSDTEGGDQKRKVYEHLTVLAVTRQGWRNLMLIDNKSHDTFWSKPRADYNLLAEHSEGLVVGTGCLGGPVAGQLLAGNPGQARANLARLVDIFGSGNVFVEVMDHGIAAERRIIPGLVDLAAEFGLPVVATNDAHYAGACDAEAHDAWLAISASANSKQKRVLVSDTNRFRFNGSGYHLRTAAEMHALFDGQPGTESAVANSLRFAEMAEGDIVFGSFPKDNRLPAYITPNGESVDDHFHARVRDGLIARYGTPLPPQVRARARFEEDTILSFGVPGYMLTIADVIADERARGYRVGAGRGSAVGSICAYALGITNVDPIENGLLFERFLNPTRAALPDIDSDFQSSRQLAVIASVAEKYGPDRVARIGTYGNSWAKDSLKSMGRVLDKDQVANRLAALVPNGEAKKLTLDVLLDPANPMGADLRDAVEADPEAAELVRMARAVEGSAARNTQHACGVIISDEPLAGTIPLRRDRGNDNFPVTQWDAEDSEKAKFVKYDFLAISDQDVVQSALDIILASTGERVDIDATHPAHTDERALAAKQMLAEGRTAGVFQLGSRGITELTRDIRPEHLHDLAAILALYRPGPMGAGMHQQYARRRRGGEPVTYDVYTKVPAEQDVIASVLGTTLGSVCLAKGERVYSVSRGAMVPIEDVAVGELVQGVDSDGQHRVAPVTWSGQTGRKPVFRLNLAGGFSIRLTGNHPVYTARGWVEVKDLLPDDVIASPHKLIGGATTSSSSSSLDVAEARVLGSLLGDGSFTQRVAPTFVNSEPRLAESFAEAVAARFPGCGVGAPRINRHGVPAYPVVTGVARGGANGTAAGPVLSWLREAGLKDDKAAGAHSRSKFIPARWVSRTDEAAVELIAALWDCDGRVKAETPNRGASYKTISPKLADDLRFMLLRLGVTTVLTSVPYTNPSGTSEVAYNVAVNDQRAFGRIVGPRLRHPQKRAAAQTLAGLPVVSLRDKMGSRVPSAVVRDLVRAESGRSLKMAGRMIGTLGAVGGSNMVGGGTIAALSETFNTPGLNRLAASRWLPIVSVEPDGTADVYDLTVEGLHSFVAEGVVVHNCYQEQLMQLAREIADFDGGQMSDLQKAFSKKKQEMMDALKQVWLDGGQAATRRDGTAKVAFQRSTLEELWRTFEASGAYLFNASHAYAYAMLTWQMAFLKANWPAHFGAALLANTSKEEKRQEVLADLVAEGVQVRPPSVNESQATTSVSADGAVLLGLAEVKGVGDAGRTILEERDANGPFTSAADLVDRTKITSLTVQALAEAGALDEFGPRLGLFMVARALRVVGVDVPDCEWGVVERSARQRARLGLVVGDHPLSNLHSKLRGWRESRMGDSAVMQVHNLPRTDQAKVHVLGVAAQVEEKFSKNGRRLVMTLESAKGRVEVMMWPRQYGPWLRQAGPAPLPGQLVCVTGSVRVTVPVGADSGDDAESDEAVAEPVVQVMADWMEIVKVDDPPSPVKPPAGANLTVAVEPIHEIAKVREEPRRPVQPAVPDEQQALPAVPATAAVVTPVPAAAGVGRMVVSGGPAAWTQQVRRTPSPHGIAPLQFQLGQWWTRLRSLFGIDLLREAEVWWQDASAGDEYVLHAPSGDTLTLVVAVRSGGDLCRPEVLTRIENVAKAALAKVS